LAVLSLKPNEEDLAIALPVKDKNKATALYDKLAKKAEGKKVATKNFRGSRIDIIEDEKGTFPRFYLFSVGDLWIAASSQRAAESIIKIRGEQTLFKLWFGQVHNLSKNSLFAKITTKVSAEKNLGFAFISGLKAMEAEPQSEILALPFLVISADSALGWEFLAQQDGLALKTFLVSAGNEVKLPQYKLSESYLAKMPAKLRGRDYAFYFESSNFKEILDSFLGGDENKNLKKSIYGPIDETLGISTELELLPLLDKKFVLFLSSFPSATPDFGAIFKVNDIFRAKDLLQKIAGVEVKTGGEIVTPGIIPTVTETPRGSAKIIFKSTIVSDVSVLTAKDPAWGGLSLSLALADDELVISSSQRVTRDLVKQLRDPSNEILKDSNKVKEMLKNHPDSFSALMFSSPVDVYNVSNAFLGDFSSALTEDQRLVVEGFLKTFSLLSASVAVLAEESDGVFFLQVSELPEADKKKVEDALLRLFGE